MCSPPCLSDSASEMVWQLRYDCVVCGCVCVSVGGGGGVVIANVSQNFNHMNTAQTCEAITLHISFFFFFFCAYILCTGSRFLAARQS